MADAPEELTAPSANPIFADLDIPCPHCEYNLRGLIKPRCPECGNPFDPHKVLHDFRETQPPLPILWVIRNVFSHPLGFWQLQMVRRSQGPRRTQLFFGLLFLPVVLAFACGMMVAGPTGLRGYRGEPVPLALFVGMPISLFLYMFVLIHGILCRLGLARSTAREGVRAAKEIVGYGLVWFAPVLLGIVAATRFRSTLPTAGSMTQDQAIAIAILCVIAACCVAWAITIYQGAKFVSGGSRIVAIWCTLTNPFWYILALVAIMAIG